MITRKLGPCLAAGCGAVIKPAEDTPLSALALLELGHRAGLPAGLVSVITSPREHASAVGETLCKHPQIRKLSFTGSTPVGVILAKWCAEGMKRTSLELGGNAPFIVFDDADVEVAVTAAMNAKFRNSGQTCIAANRFFVQEGIHDAFVKALVNKVSALKNGHGLEPGTTQGPLINPAGKAKVTRHIEDALSKGAQIVFGEHCHNLKDNTGNFVSPLVLVNCDQSMACIQEETFGPLVSIHKFKEEDQLLKIVNDCEVGLAGYFCSNNLQRVMRVSAALEVGMVGVNEGAISTEVAPFGGVKMSGLGREGSSHGMDEYMDMKYVCLGGLNH